MQTFFCDDVRIRLHEVSFGIFPALARSGLGADGLAAGGAIEGRLLWHFDGKRV